MTEAEWLSATDPTPMLEFLRGKVSDRKLRLFACAFCRQLVSLVGTQEYTRGLEAAETYADGGRTKAAMTRSRQALKERMVALVDSSGNGQSDEWKALFFATLAISDKDFRSFQRSLSDLQTSPGGDSVNKIGSIAGPRVRELFGNPFNPTTINPSWLTSDVVALSSGIYAEKAFDRLPILADALQDAGCDNADILNHCRSDGPHVRGCWALDLLLGKE